MGITKISLLKRSFMFRRIFFLSTAFACVACVFFGCNNSNPVSSASDGNPAAPEGATLIISDGFGDNLAKWDKEYMVTSEQIYPPMQITNLVAHTGSHSLTTDSNRTALLFSLLPQNRVEQGIVGVHGYIMAKALGQANFTLEIGQNAGSSGGLGKSWGIGFDPNDSIKCKCYDMLGTVIVGDTMVKPIELNHWYKCVVEVDFTAKTITYYLDDAKIWTRTLPTSDMYGIDRLLVFRGQTTERPNYDVASCKEGKQQYYADDIVFYKK
jgi:hypothetical protein